ncbi:MAG: acylphosphatase [Candidatus Pacebacteria bacterium]|nr:acylphosphatase [Candidatus Paceibacterota bacterium]
MAEKVRAHIFVNGFVQGVFFRQNTLKRAKKIGVFGFVRNLPDGRVEAVFEGDKDRVEKMVEWMREGPENASVNNQEFKWEEYKEEFEEFEIHY